MSEQLIRTSELCKRLGMGKNTAISVMASNGVYPICLGAGRGRGFLWLSSAVDAALLQMHEQAQIKYNSTVKPKQQISSFNLADMSIDELYDLTHNDATSTEKIGTFGHRG